MLTQKLQCIVLVMLVAVQHLVCSLPLTESKEFKGDFNQKRNTGITNPRETLRKLEQIQRYYQHLYIRGLLAETESATLERLQDFIERLRHIVETPSH